MLNCLGREVKLCFSFQPLGEEFVLRCFCSWRIFLPFLGEDSPLTFLGISSPKRPAFTRNPPFSFFLRERNKLENKGACQSLWS